MIERSAELLESEKRLRFLFENAPVSLWHEDFSDVKRRIDDLRQEGITDFREYFENNLDVVRECAERVKILDVNLATRELHQVETRIELTAMLARHFCDESFQVFREEMIALADGKAKFESDAEVLTRTGKKKDVMLRLFVDPSAQNWSSVYVAITDITERKRAEDGLRHSEALLPMSMEHFLGYRASNRDITERKNAEEELRQRDSELAHVTRVGTMGEMATVLAHEVNQPLGAIANYAGTCVHLLDSDQFNFDMLRKALTQIDQQARRAGEIINRLKRFVAGTAPNCSDVDLNELIHNVCELMRSQIPTHRASLRLVVDPTVPTVEVDVVQIQQVLVNLMQNALEAMEENEPDNSCITITSTVTAEGAQVAVCDRGHGLSPQVKDRLFEPYFSTKAKGLGMGLRISQRIIQKHGGSLSVAANPDGGTIFQFTLPAKPDCNASTAKRCPD